MRGPIIGFRTVWAVSPEDHSRGRGGFNGEYFSVRGVTDRRFDTEADAEAAIVSARPKFRKIHAPNMSGATYRHGARFLCVFPIEEPIYAPEAR